MSKVTLKVEVDEDYLESIKASTNKTSSDIILINATSITESDDCVSRQAVLDIAKSSKSNWIDNSVLFKRVNDLPPVTPKREQGEWRKSVNNGFRTYGCSKCHNFNKFNSKYCPNCGAEMR